MNYISTRGLAGSLTFKEVLLAGLASDGGLYVPETIPEFSPQQLSQLATLGYTELAYEIIAPFVGKCFSEKELRGMIDAAYGNFRHGAIAPLTQLAHDQFVLELFHGPTLAFKDFALQLLGHLMEATLKESKKKSIVVGATSGDTGSAAIAGLKGRENIDIVILYPEGRTSDVQRKQMTTLPDANVHALAVKGTFDDCQDLVKVIFSDTDFRNQVNLLAVNSINWARVMAQVVYYFYAALALGAPARSVNFSVPTGNFGDIYAGYIARRMGLPMGKLIIATNQNDILARCLKTGEYKVTGVHASLSPSMDIQVASNFERLLFDLYGRDGKRIGQMMQDFKVTKSLTLSPSAHAEFAAAFDAHAVSDKETLKVIEATHTACGYLLDPHTAVGVKAAAEHAGITVTLATAHPSKFPEAVKKATGETPALPAHMADLYERKERIATLDNNIDTLKALVLGL